MPRPSRHGRAARPTRRPPARRRTKDRAPRRCQERARARGPGRRRCGAPRRDQRARREQDPSRRRRARCRPGRARPWCAAAAAGEPRGGAWPPAGRRWRRRRRPWARSARSPSPPTRRRSWPGGSHGRAHHGPRRRVARSGRRARTPHTPIQRPRPDAYHAPPTPGRPFTRRGAGTDLTGLLVHRSHERGCATASLQSTERGERVDCAVVLRDLGRFLELVPPTQSVPFVARNAGAPPPHYRSVPAAGSATHSVGFCETARPMVASAADSEVIARLRAGDQAAFRDVVLRHHGAMVRFASGFVPSRAVAEEVAQDTWIAVIKGLDGFQGRSSLRTWIFRILANQARTRGTRERRTIPAPSLADELAEAEQPPVAGERFAAPPGRGLWAQPPPPWSEPPEERFLIGATFERFARQVAALPDHQRQVLVLRDAEGWSSDEVCEVLGLTEVNQRVLLHRARSKLRGLLEAELGGVP